MMVTIETTAPVMVTGATGYVAGWIVKELLDAGLTVHAPVRNPEDSEKVKHLKSLAAGSKGTIKFFKADLLEPGSYREAMAGCEVVFHTASPFKIDVKDPQKELVDPALLGTRNILEEANRTSSVRRVVLTSSCAAIYGDNADLLKTPAGVFTEDVWNTSSSLQHNPYSYSKTVAEKEAWAMARKQGRWNLVVLNPSLVVGPSLNEHPTSESFAMVKQMGDGTLRMGAPHWGFGMVDVRDLAKAHLAAAFTPAASGRHIISGHNSDLYNAASLLLPAYGSRYPIPRRVLPKWLLWLIGPMAGAGVTRKAIARNVNLPWRADNSRSLRLLGVTYRPLEASMRDMFEQMIERNVFTKA